ncbi:hypothetical protein TSUD_338550 [Trifolium subterraneum]|nr:hypothetical protein TSUD_338550 [Trifolium subterraneum]
MKEIRRETETRTRTETAEKSEAELRSEQEQKPKPPFVPISDGNLKLSDFSVYDDDDEPYLYSCEDFVYKNHAMRKIQEEDAKYLELSHKLSPYDAIPLPPNTHIVGGAPIVPIEIRKTGNPLLTKLSHLALEDYNQKNQDQGASFVFHDLVKCTMGCEFYFYDDDNDGTTYYTTFQAKESDSPTLTVFQAQVWDYEDDAKSPVVKECRIKI